MKKSIRVLALVLALTAVLFVFAACGKTLSGEYSAEIDIVVLKYTATYEFKGSKVTITVKLLGSSVFDAEGTYKIDGDEITFTFESDDEEADEYNGTFDFEEKEDSIKIGIVEYKKVD